MTRLTRQTMWVPLLEAAPGFIQTRQAFLEEFSDEQENLPEFLCVGRLADYTIRLFEKNNHDAVIKILSVVENWVVDGDEDVSDLAIVGFIEDLTNGARHRVTQPEDFEPLLPPRLNDEWDSIRQAWMKLIAKMNR